MAYSTDDIGFNRVLTREDLIEQQNRAEATRISASLPHAFSNSVRPSEIQSGQFVGNLNVVKGYLQSANYYAGVNGWKFDAVGNLEANSGTFRGSLYATTGKIGDWIIGSDGIYYDGTGTPYIKTSATVGAGSNGVILDASGIKVYDDTLGVVVNLPSDGSAPTFSSGEINETTFEISTNSVLRTSETVGDGTASSAGVLINNSGIYACGASKTIGNSNVRILATGDAYFSGTVNASTINSSEINSSDINGAIITGGVLRTATTGQRIEIDSTGIILYSGDTGATYGDASYTYNDVSRTYGSGVLAYINNTEYEVPIYFSNEGTVADIHLYNRSTNPSGAAEVGDIVVVNGALMICTGAGTPGTWSVVGANIEGGAVFNETGASVDFRVETNTEENMIFVDGSDDVMYLGGTTNGIKIEKGGELHLEGTATVWDDLRVTPGGFDRPGVSDPDLVAYNVNGGGVSTYLYEFAKNDIASFTVQLPHNYAEGQDLKAHVHWTPGARGNEENGATVGWKIDYSWANIEGNFPTMSTADVSDACDGTDHKHQMTPEVTITGTGKSSSSMLLCNIKRTATGTDDTWASTTSGQLPMILEIDFHYPISSLGSRSSIPVSPSASISPSVSPSVSVSRSPSISPSISPSVS